MKLKLVKEKGKMAECLGVSSERAKDFDDLVGKMVDSPGVTQLDIVKAVGDKLNPTFNEWCAFFYGFGYYMNSRGL